MTYLLDGIASVDRDSSETKVLEAGRVSGILPANGGFLSTSESCRSGGRGDLQIPPSNTYSLLEPVELTKTLARAEAERARMTRAEENILVVIRSK